MQIVISMLLRREVILQKGDTRWLTVPTAQKKTKITKKSNGKDHVLNLFVGRGQCRPFTCTQKWKQRIH